MITNRAWVLLPSGRRLDLLNPDSRAWTDQDLSVGLSRTYRWAGYSAWDLPLSVAQHSLTALAIRQASSGHGWALPEALRELLHDAEEALLGGWDPITPLKPHLGPGFDALVQRLQGARRSALPAALLDPRELRLAQACRPACRRQRGLPCRRLEPGGDARQSRHLARAARG